MFRKLLIANRGEIAVRIIRACRTLGVGCVAVYSDPDRAALHVRLADEAIRVGPGPAVDSYLRADRLIAAARTTGADAVHPGYGFLAEDAGFAAACAEHGLVFVGPTPEAMRRMGDKIEARRVARELGVPVVPGSDRPVGSVEEAVAAAREVGFPLLLKAAAGGGGKGMRLVERAADLRGAFRAAASEAIAYFGRGDVYVERRVPRARHLEVQILGDRLGGVVHLGERACSLQRRHQKLLEEAPAPAISDRLRARLLEAATTIARGVSYVNAGTVEFLVDETERFYFLEMNTRLQVEHPVTEWVTGLDLVAAQLEIAATGRLPWQQADIRCQGAAIECRIMAEDPARQFLPAPGRIAWLREPAGPGVRWDGGVYAGFEVPLDYDPLLGKLTAWGPSRQAAIARLRAAMGELSVGGPPTTAGFLRELLDAPGFLAGDYDTSFLAAHAQSANPQSTPANPQSETVQAVAAALAYADRRERAGRAGAGANGKPADRAGIRAWKLAARRLGLRGQGGSR